MNRWDLVLVGGGLANCLIAWRLAQVHPDARVCIVEKADRLGGNHTWSFHDGDLDPGQRQWIRPLIRHSWSSQSVRFPAFERELDQGYHSLTSDGLHARIQQLEGLGIFYDRPATTLAPDCVVVAEGARIEGRAVLDGRGPGTSPGMVLGFQKFLGRELRLDSPHGLGGPVIMDATVSQADGYRFVYLLPFEAHRVLVEDTYYSDGPTLDAARLRESIDDYAAGQGWTIRSAEREEQGVLPILLAWDFDTFWPERPGGVARSGLAAGLFHPTTGYSLPQAAGLADAIAARWPLDGPALCRLTRQFARDFSRRTAFFRLLSRMLFRAGRPEARYRVLERFYRLDAGLIARFYAARLTIRDQIRILAGRPPVPIGAALRVIREKSMCQKETA